MTDMLELSAALPEVTLPPGEVVIRQGDPGGTVLVLVSGSLRVLRDGVEVNTVTRPGALLGEVSVLLGGAASATVETVDTCVLRRADDGASFLTTDAAVMTHVARGLATRLDFVTTYLADLKNQYGDAPGLAMVPQVLQELSRRDGPRARPGSARDPEPLY